MPQRGQAPDTLPADFFNKPQAQAQAAPQSAAPDELPADFDFSGAPPIRSSTWADTAKSLFPSMRTITGMAGGMLGGALSLPGYAVTGPAGVALTSLGGGAGYAAGTKLYDTVTGNKPDTTPLEDVLSGALQEAGGPMLAKGIAGRAEKGIKKAVERAIEPTTNVERNTLKDISLDLAKDMPVALNKSDLMSKVQSKLGTMSQQLESEWTKIPYSQRIPTDEARIALLKARAGLLNERGDLIPGHEKLYSELTNLIDYLVTNPSLSPGDVRNHRALWDKVVNWWRMPALGKSTEPEREEAYRVAANGIRETINKLFPSIKSINSKMSPWIDAMKMMGSAETKTIGKEGSTSLYRFLPEAGGAGGGYLLGKLLGIGGTEGAALGMGAVALRQLMNTTAWHTASIPVREQVVKLMNKGLTQEALGLLLGQSPKAVSGALPTVDISQ